jgi:hypothetical protein
MSTWTKDELDKIAAAGELELASLRRDGTLSNAVTIWVVRVGEDLYVRSWKGDDGAWFRATQERHEGHITAAGVAKDVNLLRARDRSDDRELHRAQARCLPLRHRRATGRAPADQSVG